MKLKILFFLLSILTGFWVSYPAYSLTTSLMITALIGALSLGVMIGIELLIKNFPTNSTLGLLSKIKLRNESASSNLS